MANAGEATKEMAGLIARVFELDAKATAGPWNPMEGIRDIWVDAPEIGHWVCDAGKSKMKSRIQEMANAETIAEYRTAAPILASEVQRLAEELRRTDEALLAMNVKAHVRGPLVPWPAEHPTTQAIAAARARREKAGGG